MNDQPGHRPLEQDLNAVFTRPDPDPAFLDGLEGRLKAQLAAQDRRPARRLPFWGKPGANGPRLLRPSIVAVGILVGLAILVAAIGPQQVLAAVRGIIGYIPGIGFVDNAETAQKIGNVVRVERDGVTVTIQQAVADANSTRINLRADGFRSPTPAPMAPSPKDAFLLLANGDILPLTSGQSSSSLSAGTITAQYAFAPLPPGVDRATLVLPGLPGIPPGTAPENWRIPLKFAPIQTTAPANPPMVGPWKSANQGGMTLVLDRVAQTEDGAVLQVHFDAANPHTQTDGDWWNRLTLTDESGRSYPLTEEPTADSVTTDIHLLKTGPLPNQAQLTLRLDSLDLVTTFPYSHLITSFTRVPSSAPGFSFDPGSNAHAGQTWTLKETITTGDLTLRVTGATLSAEYTPPTFPGGKDASHFGLRFSFAPLEGVSSVRLRCEVPSPCGEVTSESNGEAIFTNVLGLAEPPKQPMVIRVEDLSTTVQGPWEAHWRSMDLQK
jgi:hypothetical protein